MDPAYSGAAYQQAIESNVSLLAADHMVAILDLHWRALISSYDGTPTGVGAGIRDHLIARGSP